MTIRIKVPATTANIGAGFDSIGIALNIYLELEVEEAKKWTFEFLSPTLKGLPTDTENYIYHIAKLMAMRFGRKSLPSCHVKMKSEIPLARGLGSSSTAVVAGIALANQLLELNLSKQEIANLATEIEGHPDNVAPAIYGGCVIGHVDEGFEFIQIPIEEELTFVAAIPDFEFETMYARSILPAYYSHKEAVKASSVANVSVAAIMQKDWNLLGKMMKKDLFHQPHRKSLLPDFDPIVNALKEEVYGTYLSGAGPTMIALADNSQAQRNLLKWKEAFPHLEWQLLRVDNTGLIVE
jgi:homoserine kinase